MTRDQLEYLRAALSAYADGSREDRSSEILTALTAPEETMKLRRALGEVVRTREIAWNALDEIAAPDSKTAKQMRDIAWKAREASAESTIHAALTAPGEGLREARALREALLWVRENIGALPDDDIIDYCDGVLAASAVSVAPPASAPAAMCDGGGLIDTPMDELGRNAKLCPGCPACRDHDYKGDTP